MVVVFLLPVLAGIAFAKCASWWFVVTATMTVVPFVVIPVAFGSAVTLLLVNVFPARRARDILMLMGLVFAMSIVLLLRFLQPERLLRVESMPEVTDFFATLQSPITPLLPSFWAGEALFAGLQNGRDLLHIAALWSTARGGRDASSAGRSSAGTSPGSARRRKRARRASRSGACSISSPACCRCRRCGSTC